jgi:hypothetical protein
MSSNKLAGLPVYPRGVKKIAVCLYGCYRTGDYVLPWLKKSLTHSDVQVDYFCSTRNYDEYRTTKFQAAENNHRSDEEITELLSILNPISIEIQDYNITDQFYHASVADKSMADVIMLKQIHEATTGIEYDVVLLTRYDTLAEPMPSLAKHIATMVEGMRYDNYDDRISNARCAWISTLTQQHGLGHSPWASCVHDYFVFGSSVAMDLIALEFLKHIKPVNEKTMSGSGRRHIHMTMATAIRLQDIQIIERMYIRSTIVRPYTDLTLDPTIIENFDKLERTRHEEAQVREKE